MNFLAVVRELELPVGPNPATRWREWAQQRGLVLPPEFLDALSLGAGELLTQFSNAEQFCNPGELYGWDGFPVIPLMWENQGNFVFGLHLNGQMPAPVLICHEFKVINRVTVPQTWWPFAPDFTTFAFARLLDFQYLFNGVAEDEEWFFTDVSFTPQVEETLSRSFKRGPTTPHYYFDGSGVRHRFYRPGQRVTVSLTPGFKPYWEISAASKERFEALNAEIRGLHA